MKRLLLLVLILTQSVLFAQISDDFSDGNFTSNPTWSGTNADYLVNGAQQLQISNSVAATSYLSTAHNLSALDAKEWRVWTKQSFSPSTSNYGKIYLTSSSSDLSSDPDGFYLQLGEAGSTDAVRLFKSVGGVHTELLAGSIGQIAASFTIGIRVVRTSGADWNLYIDGSGGTNYLLAGTANDATNLLGTHFGFLDVYTVSNATNFYHDDVYVGDEVIDVTPPVLTSATAISQTGVDVHFDEALDQSSAENTLSYSLTPSIGISSATLDGTDPSLVHLVLAGSLTNGQQYTLTTNAIADVAMNVSGSQNVQFYYLVAETPSPGDVVINEFNCDPEPVVGLPSVEYVEIYNRSSKIFDLTGWKLGDNSSSGTIQGGWIMPGEYKVLTATANVDSFTVAYAVSSFPSLNNSGDAIVLKLPAVGVIDSINYTDDWYKDPLKSGGGYAIERINPEDPCTDISDWMASNDPSGGTPGAVNSVLDLTPDTEAPYLTELITYFPNQLAMYYSERMDSTSLKDATITIQSGLTVYNHYVIEEYPDYSEIVFVENISPSQVYTITIENAADCWLNTTTMIGQFALAVSPSEGNLVINEILSDPVSGGSDYVEIYNISEKLIDAKDLVFANYDNDTIYNFKSVPDHFMLFPGEYLVFTEDSAQVKQQYPAHVPGRFVEMDLPTWNNDSGTVYLLHAGNIIDRVSYSSDWHFKLLDSKEGKSLERIEPYGPSNSSSNWHTAAEAIGFGTPGDRNSQYYPAISNGTFSYTSETVSPDNDGFEDVLQVNYEMNDNGYLGTFTIYDDRGRFVKTVFKSELLGNTGTFAWDGVREDGTKASIGTYVGVFEAFNIDGGVTYSDKKAFVVAGKI